MTQEPDQYPKATCMECGKEVEIAEQVDTGGGIEELWCYCQECDTETFHPIPGFKKWE